MFTLKERRKEEREEGKEGGRMYEWQIGTTKIRKMSSILNE